MAVNSGTNTGNSNDLSSVDSAKLHDFKIVLNDLAHKISPNLQENSVNTQSDSLTEVSLLNSLTESLSYAQQQIKILAPALIGNNDPALLERIKSMSTDGIANQNFTDIVRDLRNNPTNNADFQSLVGNTATLVDSFESLPEMTQAKIATAQTFFRPTSFNKGAQAQQGLAIIKNAQDALDIEDPDTNLSGDQVKISQTTTRAIFARMQLLGSQNPNLGEFDAPVFDAKAVSFLENLQAKQMKEAGVTKANLNTVLLDLWAWNNLKLQGRGDNSASAPSAAMQELGETSSLLAAMRYMTSGGLTNGTATTPPKPDAPWDWKAENDNSGDIFFNPKVYDVLTSYGKVGMKELREGSAFPYRDDNLKEAIQRLREKAATVEGKQDAALQALETKFRHYEGEDSQGNPTLTRYDTALTKHEVGMIAIEIMAIQAKKLCIDEKDVNKAIEDGRLMPNRADLSLVDTGYGYLERDDFKSAEMFELYQEDLKKYGNHQDNFLTASRFTNLLMEKRSAAFEDRFGSVSANTIDKIRESAPFKFEKVDDAYIAKMYQSPAKRYGEFSAKSLQNEYDEKRQRYLNNLGARLEANGCNAPTPDLEKNKPSSAPTGGNGVSAPIAAAAAAPSGTLGVGSDSPCGPADKIGTSPCSNNKQDSENTSPCGAADQHKGPCSKQFGGAVGAGEVDTNTAIAENIEGATGNEASEPPCPPADKLAQGCKVTAPVYP